MSCRENTRVDENVLGKVNKVASLLSASLLLDKRKTKYRGRSRHRVCRMHTDSHPLFPCVHKYGPKLLPCIIHLVNMCTLLYMWVYVSPVPLCDKLIWSIVSLSCPSFKLQKLDAPPLNPPHARLSVSQTTESTAMLCRKSQSRQAKYQSAFQLEKEFCQLRKMKRTTGMTNLRF